MRGIWESVGAGRVIGTSGTPAGNMHMQIYVHEVIQVIDVHAYTAFVQHNHNS